MESTEAVGARRVKKVRIPVTHKGSLAKYGYSLKKSRLSRHRALNKAIKEYGPGEVEKKVNVLAIYHKNKGKTMGRKARSDKKFVETKLEH